MAIELVTATEFYETGTSDRKPYEDRGQLIADLTLPYLIRAEGSSGSSEMTDNQAQSYGARLINTLKSKMGMALLPPSTSSFRFKPDPAELAALTEGNSDNASEVKNLLSQATLSVNDEIENQQIRPQLFNLVSQIMVIGSTVAEKIEGKGIILHPLKSFVVELDANGKPLKICFRELLPKQKLPKEISPKDEQDEYQLYTLYQMDVDGSQKWIRSQEIEGETVGKEKKYKDYDAMPVRYFGWTWMVDDHYHRPYAEDYYKDLQQLDKLASLLTDGSIIAAKSLLLVNERGGRTRKDDVANSKNGDVIDGSAEDITSFSLDKNFDFQVPMEREANLKKELASAFLMNESATRDAERVTAEEVRFMAQELETSTLAGIYSTLAVEWSKWIVMKIMDELKIKFDAISVDVLTGLDALGRSQESQKLDGYIQRLQALEMMDWLNEAEVAQRYATYDGIDTQDLIKTSDEVEARRRAQAEAQAIQAGDEAMAAAGGAAAGEAGVKQASQPPPQ